MRSSPVLVVVVLVAVHPEVAVGVPVPVGSGFAEVKVGWWYPFGDALGVLAGYPALLEQFVVGAAGEGEVIDVGAAMDRPLVDVLGFGEVAGRGAAGSGAAAVLGEELAAPGQVRCEDCLGEWLRAHGRHPIGSRRAGTRAGGSVLRRRSDGGFGRVGAARHRPSDRPRPRGHPGSRRNSSSCEALGRRPESVASFSSGSPRSG